MTLLSIAQAVADQIGIPRPVVVATGATSLPRQMFSLANEVIRDLRKLNWPVLVTDATFNTVVSTSSYAVESDYLRIIGNTAFNSSSYYALRNSLSSAEWQRQRYAGLGASLGRFKLRITGYPTKVNVTPTPQVVETLVYQYTSKNAIVKDDLTRGEYYTLDTDNTVLPEELVQLGLKWRIKHARGLDYAEDFNEYEAAKGQIFAQSIALEDIPVAVRSLTDTGEVLTGGYVPENGFG